MTETSKDYTQTMSDEFQKFADKSAWKDDGTGDLTQTLQDGAEIEIVRADSHYQPIVTFLENTQYGDNQDSQATAIAWAWNNYQARRLALYEEFADARIEMSF